MDLAKSGCPRPENHTLRIFKKSASIEETFKMMKKTKKQQKNDFLRFLSIFVAVVQGIYTKSKNSKTLHSPEISRLNWKNPWNFMFESPSQLRCFMKLKKHKKMFVKQYPFNNRLKNLVFL